MPIEETDLHRRVLAHERILQALISHMAEIEPDFLTRLHAIFTEPVRMDRPEHDYRDTASYAADFLKTVVRLGADRTEPTELPTFSSWLKAEAHGEEPDAAPRQGVTLLQIFRRSRIWHVHKDGSFLGDYRTLQHARDAADKAMRQILATGGIAQLVLPHELSAVASSAA